MEIWKPVKGYEGLYEVSDQGNVYSLLSDRVLKQGTTGRYAFVVLVKDKKRKDLLVHRLVAEQFCQKREGATEVNHINENKLDNRASNLEWCTRLENIRHGTGIERRATAQRNRHGNKEVLQIAPNGNVVAKYPSLREVQRTMKFDKTFVSRCASGRCESAYGFKWKFVNTKSQVTTA